jgi:uncharacterized protein YqiB (DUF1249 family)
MEFSRITLYNFVQRYVLNKRLLEKHPEEKELLNKAIKEAEKYILEILERNADNEILKHLV